MFGPIVCNVTYIHELNIKKVIILCKFSHREHNAIWHIEHKIVHSMQMQMFLNVKKTVQLTSPVHSQHHDYMTNRY